MNIILIVPIAVSLVLYLIPALHFKRSSYTYSRDYLVTDQGATDSVFRNSSLAYALQLATFGPFFVWGVAGDWIPGALNSLFFAAGLLAIYFLRQPIATFVRGAISADRSITIHEFIAHAHGDSAWVRVIASSLTLIALWGIVMSEMFGIAAAITPLLGGGLSATYAFVAVLFLLMFAYSALGGNDAVMRSDQLQLAVSYIGLFICIVVMIGMLPHSQSLGGAVSVLYFLVFAIFLLLLRRGRFIEANEGVRHDSPRTWKLFLSLERGLGYLVVATVFAVLVASAWHLADADTIRLVGTLIARSPSGTSLPWIALVALAILPVSYQVVDITNWQRFAATGKPTAFELGPSRRALVGFALEAPLVWIALVALGAVAAAAFPPLGTSSNPFGDFVMAMASGASPIWHLALAAFLVAVFAIGLSTMDSVFSASQAAFQYDLLPAVEALRASRLDTMGKIRATRRFALGSYLAVIALLFLAERYLKFGRDSYLALLLAFYSAQISFVPLVIGAFIANRSGRHTSAVGPVGASLALVLGAGVGIGMTTVAIIRGANETILWSAIPMCLAVSTAVYGISWILYKSPKSGNGGIIMGPQLTPTQDSDGVFQYKYQFTIPHEYLLGSPDQKIRVKYLSVNEEPLPKEWEENITSFQRKLLFNFLTIMKRESSCNSMKIQSRSCYVVFENGDFVFCSDSVRDDVAMPAQYLFYERAKDSSITDYLRNLWQVDYLCSRDSPGAPLSEVDLAVLNGNKDPLFGQSGWPSLAGCIVDSVSLTVDGNDYTFRGEAQLQRHPLGEYAALLPIPRFPKDGMALPKHGIVSGSWKAPIPHDAAQSPPMLPRAQTPSIRSALEELTRILWSDDGRVIWITGEPGSGKEVFAQALHHGAKRRKSGTSAADDTAKKAEEERWAKWAKIVEDGLHTQSVAGITLEEFNNRIYVADRPEAFCVLDIVNEQHGTVFLDEFDKPKEAPQIYSSMLRVLEAKQFVKREISEDRKRTVEVPSPCENVNWIMAGAFSQANPRDTVPHDLWSRLTGFIHLDNPLVDDPNYGASLFIYGYVRSVAKILDPKSIRPLLSAIRRDSKSRSFQEVITCRLLNIDKPLASNERFVPSASVWNLAAKFQKMLHTKGTFKGDRADTARGVFKATQATFQHLLEAAIGSAEFSLREDDLCEKALDAARKSLRLSRGPV